MAGSPVVCEAPPPVTAALDLSGQVTYFAAGAALPAGRYQVRYLDGCMKYAERSDWTVHASRLGIATAYLVWDAGDPWAVLPGTFGNTVRRGAFEEFDECVAANQALDPLVFDFEGGMLGVWLVELNYDDNTPSPSGIGPTWELVQLDACPE